MTLKQLRHRTGLTQEQVANALCAHQTTVHLWERGQSKPSRPKRRRLAQLYGCTEQELAEAIIETQAERS